MDSKTLVGFAEDVLAVEPLEVDEPLIKHPNTYIAAHVVSLTATSYAQMCAMTTENTLAILK